MTAARKSEDTPRSSLPELALNLALVGLIVVLFAAKFTLLYRLNINWDEFLFASKIYMFERGELTHPLQSFHVHLFGWLKSMPGTGIDQILAARQALFVLRVLSCLCVFAIGRKLYGTTGALVAVFASLAFSYMIMHGESFRADPLISFCFIASASLIILWPERIAAIAAAAGLMALSSMISIKTVIYGPTIAALLGINWVIAERRAVAFRNGLMFCLLAVTALASLFLLHRASLSLADAPSLSAKLADTGGRMWNPPSSSILQLTRDWDWAWWWGVMLGGIVALLHAWNGDTRSRRVGLTLLALLLPLITLDFYRNSFPYYYVCLVPAAALAIGYVAATVRGALPTRPALAAIAIAIALAPIGVRTADLISKNSEDTVNPQRQVLNAVRTLFPEPVPYIDRCSMVIDYPKLGVFMSTLVASKYREQGTPVMQALVELKQPPFLIENSPGLYLDMSVEKLATSPYRLLPEDHLYLQKHYIPHWGPIRVAGQKLELSAAPRNFSVPVAGIYTLESVSPVMINGETHEPGATLNLDAGEHSASAPVPTSGVLRFGDHLPNKFGTPPARNLFTGLTFRQTPSSTR